MQPFLLTPYAEAQPNSPEERYTRQHIIARNCVERCIGVLKNSFRCLLRHRVLHYKPDKAAYIIYACAVLHNILRRHTMPLPLLVDEQNNPHGENEQENEVEEDDFLNTGRAVRGRFIREHFNN